MVEWVKKTARLMMLSCVFLALLLLTYFETEVFVSSAHAILRSGPLMAALIFAHNSLAATCVVAGMYFAVYFAEVMPERFRRRDVSLLKHPKIFSFAFAVLLVFGSIVRFGALNIMGTLHTLLPVATVEVYGLYLATLTGLRRCVSAKNMAKVYAVFLFGAVVETVLILHA